MDDFRKDISALIKLKFDLETAINNNDSDRVSEIFEEFRKTYEKITGKSFDEGFSAEKITKIGNAVNANEFKNGIEFEELESEIGI